MEGKMSRRTYEGIAFIWGHDETIYEIVTENPKIGDIVAKPVGLTSDGVLCRPQQALKVWMAREMEAKAHEDAGVERVDMRYYIALHDGFTGWETYWETYDFQTDKRHLGARTTSFEAVKQLIEKHVKMNKEQPFDATAVER